MPDIALRTYLEEIDGMIDGSRVEEAIAHLKHILGIYPKNLEAYRLLAKGLLEKNKHLDAADVFQRVLSSVPDDFIAHVGMAVVREDEGNLDAAIWHMERAYEVQPSNGPVQEELRRLYGKRDGGELPRLRLSRAALARMYEKGSLYPQAIAEVRSALTEDPDRLDLKVLLATSLWRMRQRAEAAEASAKLLEVLPYCREANRILAHVWAEEGHPAEAQNYKRRLEALDPYEAFADPSHNGTGSSHVASDQVQVPRLESVYGETTSDAQRPDWMEALGIQYESTPSSAPETQDWMNVISPPAADSSAPSASPDLPGTGWLDAIRGTGPLTGPLPPSGSTTAMPEPDVPDWMRSSVAEPTPEANAAPNWMAGITPEGESTTEQPHSNAVVGGTDWLSDLFGVEGGSPAAPAATEPPAETPTDVAPEPTLAQPPAEPESTGMTGWLTALQEDAHIPDETPLEPVAYASTASTADDEVPEWLHAAANVDDSLPTLASDVPDWIRTSAAAAPPAADDGLPDWLGGSPEADAETELPAPPISRAEFPVGELVEPMGDGATPVEPIAPASELPDWLQTLPPAEEEPASTTAPDWVSAVESTAPPARRTEPLTPPEPPAEGLPAWLTQSREADEEAPAESASDVPEWLKASAAESASGTDELPGWLQSSPVEEKSTFEASVPAPDDIPAWLRLEPVANEETAPGVPDWLQSSQTEPAEAEPVMAEPTLAEAVEIEPSVADGAIPVEAMSDEQKAAIMEQAAEEIPAWMSDAGWAPRDPTIPLDSATDLPEPELEAPLAEADSEAEPEPADMPDWLRAMKPAEDSTAAPAPKAVAADAPDWLRAAMEGKASTGAEPEVASTPAEAAPPARKATAADLPDWLQTAETDPGETIVAFLKNKPKTAALPPLPDNYKPPDAPDIPDWLRTVAEPPKSDIKTSPFESISETGPLEVEPAKPPVKPKARLFGEVADDTFAVVPLAEPVETTTPVSEPAAAADPNNMTADEALAWLESLAARQGANEEELVTKRADLPWLRQPAEPEPEPPQPVSEAPEVSLTPAEAVGDGATPVESPLGELVEPTDAVAEPAEALPDWLRLPEEQVEPEPVTPAASFTPAEPVEALPSINTDDDAIAWLESLAAKQGASTEELVTTPEQRAQADDLPDWLRATEPLAEEPRQAITEPLTPVVEEPMPTFELEAVSPPEPVEAQVEAPYEMPAEIPAAPQAEVSAATMSDDEALAWLESLAVKQGANAEELVSQPESRPEELPDWLKTQMEAVESIEPVIPAVEEPVALQPVETEPVMGDGATPVEPPVAEPVEAVAAKPTWLTEMESESDQYETSLQAEPEKPVVPEPAEMSEDAALAWLESLAVKHGAATEELVSKPEARSEAMPEWVRAEAQAEVEAEAAATEPVAVEEPEPVAEPVEPKPAWLQQMEAESDLYEASLEAAPEPAAPVSEPVAPVEPPAWLAELAAEETEPQPIAELESIWTPPAEPPLAERVTPVEAEPVVVEASAEPVAPVESVTKAIEVAPEPEPIPEVPAWLAQEPVAEPPEPPIWIPAAATTPVAKSVKPPVSEPVKAVAADAIPVEAKPKAAKKPKAKSTSRPPRKRAGVAKPSKLRRTEAPEVVLALAREHLADDKLNEAVEVYSELIASSHLLGDIITDLEAAALKRSDQPELLRTLGDAYMRDNQLQRALDAYKQALKKL